MARHGERLPYASFSGDPPTVAVMPEQWHDLEISLGKPVLLGAREQFEALCNEYLSDELLERSAVKLTDVKRCASETLKALAPFVAFAYGSPVDDGMPVAAREEFRDRFDEEITRFAIPAMIESDNDTQGIALPLTPSMITEFAIRISACLSTIAQGGGQSEVFDGSPGLQVGAALQSFLKNARAWAKGHGLPHSAMKSVDDSAAPFAAFLYAAIQIMPDELRPNVDSATAMAGHLKRKS